MMLERLSLMVLLSRAAMLCMTASVAAFVSLIPGTSRADTVASLLGNFTINQYCGLQLANDSVKLHYVVVFGQLPALRELHVADVDGDGVTTQAERDAYVQKLAPGFADQLKLSVDGIPIPLQATHWVSSLPTEQGGFSLRLDVDLAGAVPAAKAGATRTLQFSNQNYAGRIGWHEISVEPAASLQVFDTDAYSTSLTGGLTEALQALPASGPLDERSVHLSITDGALPAGSKGLQPRSESEVTAVAARLSPGSGDGSTTGLQSKTVSRTPGNADNNWLQVQTRRLIGLISAPHVSPEVALLALLAAVVLGALHAFSPGHGKAIVGAYLIGSRGTPRHALFLGFTVTVTHTLGVFALGFATLFASRYVVPERLFPILSLISGLLVLGMGIVLLIQRWRSARDAGALSGSGDSTWRVVNGDGLSSVFGSGAALAPTQQQGQTHRGHHHSHGPTHDHGQGHSHYHHGDHGETHGHDHAPDAPNASMMHSHGGGTMHSHLPPGAAGEKVSWRGLLALGISGGLVPCPSAMVLLLAAVALNKTAYGLLLVVAFSVGLAMTLTAVGLMFLYARNRFRRPLGNSRWPQLLPVLSAAAITVVGALLCYGALVSTGY